MSKINMVKDWISSIDNNNANSNTL